MKKHSNVTLPAKVQQIIAAPYPSEPEMARILITGADPLYDELHIENSLTDGNGEVVRLKQGAEVFIIITAGDDAFAEEEYE
jgi:hypothetical protein